jgi:hypothetical protein
MEPDKTINILGINLKGKTGEIIITRVNNRLMKKIFFTFYYYCCSPVKTIETDCNPLPEAVFVAVSDSLTSNL